MKVLVTGATGQLGRDVMRELSARGITAIGTAHKPPDARAASNTTVGSIAYPVLDITDEAAVTHLLKTACPTAVIHCAAWTAVDAAEDAENRARVFSVNSVGTRHIATVCQELGCRLAYVSTDYVFDGHGDIPWQPDGKDCLPLNVYGQSKREGELIVSGTMRSFFIVRTSWAFGPSGNNFITTMLSHAKTHDTIRVVNDQIGTPTYTPDLARLLVDMIQTEKYGFYHAVNEGGYISWYGFAREIFRQAGISVNLIPVTTEEYNASKAQRPLNSRLDTTKLLCAGFCPLPSWRDALARYLRQNV